MQVDDFYMPWYVDPMDPVSNFLLCSLASVMLSDIDWLRQHQQEATVSL